jgi:hypothetical protein
VLWSLGGPDLLTTLGLAMADPEKPYLVLSLARLAVPEIQAATAFDELLSDLVARSAARADAAQRL